MNECVDSAESSKITFEEAGSRSTHERPSATITAAVTVSATAPPVATTSSGIVNNAPNDSLPPAEALWNQFLRNISQQSHSSQRKYPNPEVPEFYPRNAARVAARNSEEPKTSTDTAANTSSDGRLFNKNDEILKPLNEVAALPNARSTDMANPLEGVLSRYCWSLRHAAAEYVPRSLSMNWDANGAHIKYACPAIEYPDTRVQSSTMTASTPSLPTTSKQTFKEWHAELNTKNQQLAHLNNVVKALLEEIWKINELAARYTGREQWRKDVSFAINEFLKPTTELGFHCDDCCDRLKEFVTRVSKQLEHKMAKQHDQYKNNLVGCVLSVVENSLRALTQSASKDFKSRLLKHDVSTQTVYGGTDGANGAGGGRQSSSKMEARKSKLQITKIYRNRNFYKRYEGGKPADKEAHWYANTLNRGEQPSANDRRSSMRCTAPKSYSFQPMQPTHDDAQNRINPIQLIHQKYKNLNCRLEGIPDKNLVKFSYIVNGREYSAIASTKRKAQYHCAWHVLDATSHE